MEHIGLAEDGFAEEPDEVGAGFYRLWSGMGDAALITDMLADIGQ